MAFFKFRKGGDDQTSTASQPESVEVMRRRARHRLIGSMVLVLVGVIGFPLLVDKKPRSVSVDVQIDIPDRHQVQPLPQPAPPAPLTPVAKPAAPVAPAAVPEPKPEPKPAKLQVEKSSAKLGASGKPPVAATRFVVQVGAFSEAPKAREVRLRLERAGLKTYTQVIGTESNRRIRVRVGPYASRAEAEKAADKVKKLDLPAVLIEL